MTPTTELQAGRELDAFIARLVMKLPEQEGWTGDGSIQRGDPIWRNAAEWPVTCPKYSTDIAAAWQVVESFAGRSFETQERFYDALCDQWHDANNGRNAIGDDEDALVRHLMDSAFRWFLFRAKAPEAICRAALKAVETT